MSKQKSKGSNLIGKVKRYKKKVNATSLSLVGDGNMGVS